MGGYAVCCGVYNGGGNVDEPKFTYHIFLGSMDKVLTNAFKYAIVDI